MLTKRKLKRENEILRRREFAHDEQIFELLQRIKDLTARVQYLVDYTSDEGFAFPDGEYWRASE